MVVLDTVHKRKSAAITTVITILLLLLIFFFGMTYLDPPIESGIAVNFGTSERGSGAVQPKEPVKTKINPQVTKEEVVKEEVEERQESTPEESKSEEVLTNDEEETIRINKAKEAQIKVEEAERLAKEEADRIVKEKAEEDRKKKEEVDRIQKEQDDKKKKLDALIGGINNNDGSQLEGHGDDDIGGDKGKITGDPNASGFYGNGGSGGSGDYRLGNRKPLNKPKPKYECDEEGVVVVTIKVNREGRVVEATAGTKGSTNLASCLLVQAKAAALKTTWEPDSNAGERQIGIINYRFSLAN